MYKGKRIPIRPLDSEGNKRYAIFAVDFDGTVVDDCYPETGQAVPLAMETLKVLTLMHHKIVMYTMRSGKTLEPARLYYHNCGVPLYAINRLPGQGPTLEGSPKCYADYYIDDRNIGTGIIKYPGFKKPCVDWVQIRKLLKKAGLLPKSLPLT